MAAALVATVYGLRAYKKQLATEQLLAQASEFEQSGDWRAAAQRLDEYLQIRPLEDEQRVRLARIWSAGASTLEERKRAIDLLYRALGTGLREESDELREQLAQHLLHCERWPEAEVEACKILEKRPNNVGALRIRALALAHQYHSGELYYVVPGKLSVLDWLQVAHELHPADLEVTELFTSSLLDTELVLHTDPPLSTAQREQLANGSWQQLLDARPCDPLVYLARYRFRSRWRIPGASEDLAQALLWGRGHPAVQLAAIELAQREALAFLDQNLVFPEPQPQVVSLPELLRKPWPELSSVHRLMRGQDPNTSRSELFEVVRAGSPADARVLALRGEWDVAEEMLLAGWGSYSPFERAEAAREIVQQRLSRGDIDEALTLLAEMVRQQPENVPLRELAAEIEMRYDHAQATKEQDGSEIMRLP